MELAFWFFYPPPIFRVLNSFFDISWAHGTTRYMCQNGCFGGVFLVCKVMLTISAAGGQTSKKGQGDSKQCKVGKNFLWRHGSGEPEGARGEDARHQSVSVWVQGTMQAQQTRTSDKALTHTHSCPASAQCTAFVTAACLEMHFC